MFKVGIGHAEGIHTGQVIRTVLAEAADLGPYTPKAGIIMADIGFDHECMLSFVLKQYPDIMLVGCTTVGNFSSAWVQ